MGSGRLEVQRCSSFQTECSAIFVFNHSCLDLEIKIEWKVEFISAAEIGVTGSISLLELQRPEDEGTICAVGRETSLLAHRHGKRPAGRGSRRNINDGKESDVA